MKLRPRLRLVLALLTACGLALASTATAADPTAADIQKSITRGTDFLKKAQESDGSFSSKTGPGITAIVTCGLLRTGSKVDDPAVARALKYLESNRHDDGGVYQKGSNHKNYETCL